MNPQDEAAPRDGTSLMRTHRSAVLVSGGAGYIGSHTAKALKAAGFTPVVLDNFSTGNRFALQFGESHEGSMEDTGFVGDIIRKHSIEAVVLFSACAYVGESTRNPRKYYSNNLTNSIRFLDAVLDSGVRNLIFSSSCAIYGIPPEVPITESSPPNPLSPYGETKYFMERILRWYGESHGLRSLCLRYFNAAGADESGEIGEHHDPETHLIPLAIYAGLGKGPLSVMGNDYPTLDGTAIRDYIHVTDLADAHVRAVQYLLDGGRPVNMNLGAGRGTSILEVLRMVEQVSGAPVPHWFVPRRLGDAPELVADAGLAQATLGWKAVNSDLAKIVQTAWKWHRKPIGVGSKASHAVV